MADYGLKTMRITSRGIPASAWKPCLLILIQRLYAKWAEWAILHDRLSISDNIKAAISAI